MRTIIGLDGQKEIDSEEDEMLSEMEDLYPLSYTEDGYSFTPLANRTGIYEYEVFYYADDLVEPTSLFDSLVFIVLDNDMVPTEDIENVVETNNTTLDPTLEESIKYLDPETI